MSERPRRSHCTRAYPQQSEAGLVSDCAATMDVSCPSREAGHRRVAPLIYGPNTALSWFELIGAGAYAMFTLVIAQRLGLESDLTLGLSLLEGVCLTIALMLLVERYLFSRRLPAIAPSAGRPASAAAVGRCGRCRSGRERLASPVRSRHRHRRESSLFCRARPRFSRAACAKQLSTSGWRGGLRWGRTTIDARADRHRGAGEERARSASAEEPP